MARKISELTGGDLFEIKPVVPYPYDYHEATRVAREEKKKNERPEIAEKVDNMYFYEVIFFGYPNCWNTMPMPVFTFLESYDFKWKTIAPFCAHEGSGIGTSEQYIARICPGAMILRGLAVRNSDVKRAYREIINWLKNNNITY